MPDPQVFIKVPVGSIPDDHRNNETLRHEIAGGPTEEGIGVVIRNVALV